MNASQQITCPKCEFINDTISKFCKNCGFSFEEIKSKPLETWSKDNNIKNPTEFEVTEQKRLRVYSQIILTIFFVIFFITLASLVPEYLSLLFGLGFLVLCPLSALSFYEYNNNLRKKFSITVEEIKLQKTHKLIKIRWDEFSILKIKIKGEFSVDFPSNSAIYRDYTKFRILCIDQKSNKTIQSFKFRFYNKMKAKEVLNILVKFAQIKNKEVILKKKHMDSIIPQYF